MRAADRSLLLTAVLGLLAGGCLVAGGLPAPLTAAAGALLALGLPGYALLRALFAGHHLETVERVVLVLGLNLAAGILAGFVLHLLPPGLSTRSWGAMLGCLTMACCAVAWIREHHGADATAMRAMAVAPGLGGDGAEGISPAARALSSDASMHPRRALVSASQLTMLAAAGVVSALALVVARAGVAAQPQPGYTALWIHPDDSGTMVRVGVTDSEGHAQGYRLVVTLDGAVLSQQDDLSVSNGVTSVTEVQLPPAGAILRDVAVQLWRAEDSTAAAPYRSVRASVRGRAGGIAPPAGPAASVAP